MPRDRWREGSEFSRKRKENIIKEQEAREKEAEGGEYGWERVPDAKNNKKIRESVCWKIDFNNL